MSLCFMLTAGQGTRLKPYTDYFAKPTLPLLNMPLAYYGFYLAQVGGFKEFLLNKHHLPDQIENFAGSLRPYCRNVATVDETSQLLGSGGALWNARDILRKHEFFMIANGDEVLIPEDDKTLNTLVRFFKEKETLSCLLTCDHHDLLKSLKPVWVTPDQTVVGFGMDKPPGDPLPVHYTGYKVFSSKILDWIPDGESNIFYDVLVEVLSQGKDLFHFHLSKASWFETGNPHSFFAASRSLADDHWGAVNERRKFFGWKRLWKGQSNHGQLVSQNFDHEQRLNEITGHVVLGESIVWKPDTPLKNCIVFAKNDAANVQSPQAGLFMEEIEK